MRGQQLRFSVVDVFAHEPLIGVCAHSPPRDAKRLSQQLRLVDGQGCYLFSLDPVDPAAAAHTRFFNPTVGIVEDPATGSAAGPLACYLAKYGRIASFATVLIEQGYAQERPSRIEVRLRGDEVCDFGAGMTVAEGVLRL